MTSTLKSSCSCEPRVFLFLSGVKLAGAVRFYNNVQFYHFQELLPVHGRNMTRSEANILYHFNV